MHIKAGCDEKCKEKKLQAEEATNNMIDAMNLDLEKKETQNKEMKALWENLGENLVNGGLDNVFEPLQHLSELNNTELQTQMDNKVEQLKAAGKIAAGAAKELKKELHEALAQGAKSFGIKDFKSKLNNGLSVKLAGSLKKSAHYL